MCVITIPALLVKSLVLENNTILIWQFSCHLTSRSVHWHPPPPPPPHLWLLFSIPSIFQECVSNKQHLVKKQSCRACMNEVYPRGWKWPAGAAQLTAQLSHHRATGTPVCLFSLYALKFYPTTSNHSCSFPSLLFPYYISVSVFRRSVYNRDRGREWEGLLETQNWDCVWKALASLQSPFHLHINAPAGLRANVFLPHQCLHPSVTCSSHHVPIKSESTALKIHTLSGRVLYRKFCDQLQKKCAAVLQDILLIERDKYVVAVF